MVCRDTCCRDDSGPTWVPLSHRHPVAAKEHSCVNCRKPIAVGVQYHRTTGLLDGELISYAAHDYPCEMEN